VAAELLETCLPGNSCTVCQGRGCARGNRIGAPEPGFTMAERLQDYRATSTIDILDRVLDKGIVIDGWWRFYVGGLHLMTIDARVVVASIETYLRHAPILAQAGPLSWGEVQYSLPVPAVPPEVPPVKKPRARKR